MGHDLLPAIRHVLDRCRAQGAALQRGRCARAVGAPRWRDQRRPDFAVASALFRNRLAAAASAAALAMAPHTSSSAARRSTRSASCRSSWADCGASERICENRIRESRSLPGQSSAAAFTPTSRRSCSCLSISHCSGSSHGTRASSIDEPWPARSPDSSPRCCQWPSGWHSTPKPRAACRLQYNRADPGSATLMQAFTSGGTGATVRKRFASTGVTSIRRFCSSRGEFPNLVHGQRRRVPRTGSGARAAWPLLLARDRLVRLLVVIGLLAAPLPAVIKGAPYAIQRASGLLIFVSLPGRVRPCITRGLDARDCPRDSGRARRLVGVAVCELLPRLPGQLSRRLRAMPTIRRRFARPQSQSSRAIRPAPLKRCTFRRVTTTPAPSGAFTPSSTTGWHCGVAQDTSRICPSWTGRRRTGLPYYRRAAGRRPKAGRRSGW